MSFILAQYTTLCSSVLANHVFYELRGELSLGIFSLLFNMFLVFVLELNLDRLLSMVVNMLGRNHLVRGW